MYARNRNITIIQLRETKTTAIFLGDDGIIRCFSFCETHALEDAKEVITAFKEIVKDKKYPLLVDSSRVKVISPDSMKFYGSEEAMFSVKAVAVIIKSGISRIVANFFIDISRAKDPPRRLFNDENKAVKWLKTFLIPVNTAAETAEQVNILVYEPIGRIQKSIIYTLIKNGIGCLCLNQQDKKNILSKLKSKKFNAFLCDCYPGATEIIDIIKEIKNDAELNFVKIILWANPSTRSFFEEMIMIGIKGIILKPFAEEVFEKSIIRLLYGEDGSPDRRRIIRVEPDENDRIIAAIRSSTTHKTVIGKVKFISMEGMAIEMTGEIMDEDIKENEVIANNNIKITLNDNDISANGIIFKRKQNIAIIKFTEMQDYYKNMLSSYIYQRLEL
jgi:DNA-binding response OmpR family regulator